MTTAEKNLENDPDEASAIMMTLFESLAKKLSMLESTVRVRRSDLIDHSLARPSPAALTSASVRSIQTLPRLVRAGSPAPAA